MKKMIIFGAIVIALITNNVSMAKEVTNNASLAKYISDDWCPTHPKVVLPPPPKPLDLLKEKINISQDLNKSNMQAISTQINSPQINQANVKLNNN